MAQKRGMKLTFPVREKYPHGNAIVVLFANTRIRRSLGKNNASRM